MSDIFGDQLPFSRNNPLENAIVASTRDRESADTERQVLTRSAESREIARTFVHWGVAVGGAYVAAQHGPRPTLEPAVELTP